MRYTAYLDGDLFFDTAMSDDAVCLTSASIDLEAGSAGTFVFSVPPTNTAYGEFKKLSSIVSVYRDDTEIFYGRVYGISGEFNTIHTITCEGYLAALNDSIITPFTHASDLESLVSAFVSAHNARCPTFPFTLGDIEVEDDYVYRAYIEYETAWTRLTDLVDSYGGYLAARHDIDAGIVYLDWVEEYATSLNQTIDFGSNLIDLTQESTADGIITALIPFGATETDDDGNETTVDISSVTDDGVNYIYDEDAVAEFGWVWGTKTWESVYYPENLLLKAKEYLADVSISRVTINVTAVDLSMIGESVESFEVGVYYKVTSEPHGIEGESFLCTELSLNLLNPSGDRLTLGSEKAGYVSQANAEARSNRLALENVYANYTTNAAVTALKTLVVQNTSLIEQLAESITLTVGSWTSEIAGTDEDGNTITIAEYISTLALTAEEIKLSVQANTDAIEELASITIDASSIRLEASAIAWESTYSSMTEDGTLTCVNAVLNSATVYGTVVSENEDWVVSMTSGMINFYYDNTYYGGISSTFWWEDNSYAGIRMLLGDAGTYIAFEYGDPTSMETVDPSYLINFGLNPDDITQRHIFYSTTYFSGAVTAASYIYAQSNIRISNGKYIQWYDSSGSLASMICLSSTDIFWLGSGGYDTYVRGDPLHLGSTSYVTYLYGSSITVSGTTTFASAVTCDSTLTVASYLYAQSYIRITNGKYIQWYNSSSSLVSLIYFNSSNAFNLGSASYATKLYGSSITVSGAITFSSAVACSSTLSVSGATTLSSTLSVSGATTLSSTLSVSGTAAFAKAITASNDIYIKWATSSGGTAYVLTFTSGNCFYIGDSDYETYISGSAIYIGAANNDGTYLYGSSITVGGATTFSSAVTCSSTLTVTSSATFNGTATFNSYLCVSTSYGIYFGSSSSSVKLYKSSSYSILHAGTSFCIPNGSYYYALTSSGGYLALIQLTSGDAVYVGSSSYVTYVRGSTLYLNGSSYSSSDLRLKCDVEPLGTEYLEVLDGLAPMRYRFKGASQLRAGFVAQDVMEALGALRLDNILVSQDEDGMYYLDYNAIIPILVAGYQNLKRRISSLEGSL